MTGFRKFLRMYFQSAKNRFDEVKEGEKYHLYFCKSTRTFTAPSVMIGSVGTYFADSYVHIFLSQAGISQLNINVKFPEADTFKQRIVDKIKYPQSPRPVLTNVVVLNKDMLLFKGNYLYGADQVGAPVYEHPYFGIFSISEGKIVVIYDHELLRPILINQKYYFVTHFQKPESCSSGVIIYRLEDDGLAEAFLYYEDNFELHKLE